MSVQTEVSLKKGGHPKSKRSFISRLPSFRKKKTTPAVRESEHDMHLRSAEEDLKGCQSLLRPSSYAKTSKDDLVKRRSKTSSIVASYEKRLSDLKDEESRTLDKKNGHSRSATLGMNFGKAPADEAQKSSRFGFGFAWQKITSFENGNVSRVKHRSDEVNANVNHDAKNTGRNFMSRSLDLQLPIGSPHGSPPDRDSSGSVRTPDSDRSSCGSNSSAKVYGQPMPYKSIFIDEPRGIKRQASTSSQSEGLNSSGVSLSSSISPLHDKNRTSKAPSDGAPVTRVQTANSTFTKDENGIGTNASVTNHNVLNRTFPIEESPTCIVNRTFKLEPVDCSPKTNIHSISKTASVTGLELALAGPGVAAEENSISCEVATAQSSTPTGRDCDASCRGQGQITPSKTLDEVSLSESDALYPTIASTPANVRTGDVPGEIASVFSCIRNSLADLSSPRHRLHPAPLSTLTTMGSMQSATDDYPLSSRPLDLPLVAHPAAHKPQLGATKHCSESLDSCELDSICSEDLMCDTRFMDDDTFDSRDESCLQAGRSMSIEETAAMYRAQSIWSAGRTRAVSLGQIHGNNNSSLEKRVGVTRGMPVSSPLGLLSRRPARASSYPSHPTTPEHDACQSPVEELHSLINSSNCYPDVDRTKATNANASRSRSQSGSNTIRPLRPPRWPSFPAEDEGAILVDAAVYRHMIQDMTSVKTMLLKLKRALQSVDNSSSPFEHLLGSPCNSLPTSPMSEINPIQETLMEDLREENNVLRKEVRNLQESLVDTQLRMKELQLKQQVKPKQRHAGTQCKIPHQDQSLQVNMHPKQPQHHQQQQQQQQQQHHQQQQQQQQQQPLLQP